MAIERNFEIIKMQHFADDDDDNNNNITYRMAKTENETGSSKIKQAHQNKDIKNI